VRDLYKHPKWQEKRTRILGRDGFCCVACGDKETQLDVHHIGYHGNPWDPEDDALQTLCRPCHEALGKHPKGGLRWVQLKEGPGVAIIWCPVCQGESFSRTKQGCKCNTCEWSTRCFGARVEFFWEESICDNHLKGNEMKNEKAISKAKKTAIATTNHNVRRDLDELGLAYRTVVVAVSSIDVDCDDFQTRQESWTADAIERYSAAVNRGEQLPEMLLARRPGNDKLAPVCGRHRSKTYYETDVDEVSSAIVVDVTTKADEEKLTVISRRDNLRNGVPQTMDANYESIASECIASAEPGYMPKKETIDSVARRNNLNSQQVSSLKKHIKAVLFRQKCVGLKIARIPESVSLCSAAYEFAGREGFPDIAKTICANQAHKQIVKVVRSCNQQRMSGSDACNYIRDNSGGYTNPGQVMGAVAKVRIDCKTLLRSAELLEKETLFDASEVQKLKAVVEGTFGAVVQAVELAEERASS